MSAGTSTHHHLLRAWRHCAVVPRTAGMHRGPASGYEVARGQRDYWLLYLIFSGRIELTGRFGTIAVDAKHAVLLPPGGRSRERGLRGTAVRAAIIQFAVVPAVGWANPLERLPLPAPLAMDDDAPAAVDALLAECDGWRLRDEAAALRARWALDRILGLHLLRGLSGGWRERLDAGAPSWLRALAEQLRRDCIRPGPPRLTDIARAAGCSVSHVAHAFRAAYGMTPRAWVQAERMRLASVLLRSLREAPIADIARRCGYRDQSLFGRHVRLVLGMTPRAWRAG